MNYRDADRGRLITLIGRMTAETPPGARDIRAIIQRYPALEAYLPDLAADREALLKTGQIVEEEPPSDATAALRREADRRAEAGVKLIRHAIAGAVLEAVAEGRDADAARFETIDLQLFEDGVAFLGRTADAQIGATDRLLERAAGVAAVAPLRVNGKGFTELLALSRATNEAFRAALLPPPPSSPASADPTEFALRQQVAATLNAFESALVYVLRRESDESRREDLLAVRAFIHEVAVPPSPRPTSSSAAGSPVPDDIPPIPDPIEA